MWVKGNRGEKVFWLALSHLPARHPRCRRRRRRQRRLLRPGRRVGSSCIRGDWRVSGSPAPGCAALFSVLFRLRPFSRLPPLFRRDTRRGYTPPSCLSRDADKPHFTTAAPRHLRVGSGDFEKATLAKSSGHLGSGQLSHVQ